MMTAISPDVATQSHTTVHLVTEKELSQYEEYVISKFDLFRSYMVFFRISYYHIAVGYIYVTARFKIRGPFQNGLTRFKMGQPVLKWATG